MSSLVKKLLRRFSGAKTAPVPEGNLPKPQLATLLPAAPTVIEAGAHLGKDTVEMSRLWPDGRIHAFEPAPALFEKLAARTAGCRNVTLYPLALAEKSGTVEFNLSSGKSNASSSILSPKQHLEQHPEVVFQQKIKVEAVSLDDWAARHGLKSIDFLWLDLQGYELFALKGAAQILPSVRVIYTEVFLQESYAGTPLYPEVRQWLEQRGFSVAWEGLPWPDSGNVLFVRR